MPGAPADSGGLLSAAPADLEGLGVRLRVPAGSVVEQIPGTIAYRIDDGRDPPRFLIRVQSMVASAASSSPQQQFEQHIRFLREKETDFSVIRDFDLDFGGARGKLAYLAMPAGDGVLAITGWLVIQTGPNTFVVFSVITSGVDFPEVEPLLARAFETIDLSALESVAAQQLTRRERTERFLRSLTPQKLRSVADDRPRWYRIYRPGAGRNGTDLEIGFLRIRAFEGERGEVSDSSRASPRSVPEMGLMVELIAKMMVDGDPAHTVDIQSRFWQSWDRQAESWSTVNTERLKGHAVTAGQTGWRARPISTNERGSILTVVNSSPMRAVNADEQARSRVPSEWEIPDTGYINQAEVILLGSLLPRDGSLDGEFAFYWYDSRTNRLPQRIDRWERVDDQSRSATGSGASSGRPSMSSRYSLTSRPSADGAEFKQLFGADGERLRRIDADGLVTELIEHAELLRLWKSKGLPTG